MANNEAHYSQFKEGILGSNCYAMGDIKSHDNSCMTFIHLVRASEVSSDG